MSPPHKRNRNFYCAYHNDHGHDTESCNDLKNEIEDCLKNGMRRQYMVKNSHNRAARWIPRQNNRGGPYHGPRAQQTPAGQNSGYRPNLPALPAPNPGANPGDTRNITGIIQTIFGGIPEGTSKTALKTQARRVPPQEPIHQRLRPEETITFSEADVVPPSSPHTDALVIQAILANKEVHRVHIDQGSAVDIR